MIIDSQNSDNEDDEQFVVEAAPQLSEIAEIEMVSNYYSSMAKFILDGVLFCFS